MDAQRMVAARWFAYIAPLSSEEEHELNLSEGIRKSAIEAEQNPERKAQLHYAHEIALMRRQAMQRTERPAIGGRRRNLLAEYQKLMRRGW